MFIVIFDKSGDKSLLGWHYEKLREFDPEWIQQSVVELNDLKTALEFAERLLDFGVEDVKLFKASDFTNKLENPAYT